MNYFYRQEVENAFRLVCEKLEVRVDEKLQREYQNGEHPTLLSYEKVDSSEIEISGLQKYLIGTKTFLNQPTNYFDIWRSGRHVLFIQLLATAVSVVMTRVDNYQSRIEKLRNAADYDNFESIFYELLTASRYALCAVVNRVAFLDENSAPAPDIRIVTKNKGEFYVECKKFDRSVDIVSDIRKTAKEKIRLAIQAFIDMKQSALIEIAFHKDPKLISAEEVRSACVNIFRNKGVFVSEDFTLNVKSPNSRRLDDFILYPSPKFYSERYGFEGNSDWVGIFNVMHARHAHHASVADSKKQLISTWLDEIGLEVAVKWKVTDRELIWKQKRLGYSLIFKGLDQLQSRGPNSVLHVWFERDHSLGHRKDELMHFFNKLRSGGRDVFSWLIFNETVIDVSPKGNFDLIEHAHIIEGPSSGYEKPIITNVFTDSEFRDGEGAFGIGAILPNIDDL